ncbi:glycoside hydrolase family 3 C-terminal domain-containing protein [Microtetraspora sp. AC03309]|uniref:glycoside hydrolase family 3 C-terminal domain-containing protein n=1 Tax=Microtetraspora sp. AC03309 TaxID=2779376 RepID=UPI001E329F3C|nr:glycoside hydrolase family 3 C-terminal domain-containing protein [Microtetraspora sp. AC03309]MCC5578737.1 glycoside hydrolase family 3 C-terminal domain-containing protein [Microtetraspora sp. AC03309]
MNDRVGKRLEQMTVEEKAQQLTGVLPQEPRGLYEVHARPFEAAIEPAGFTSARGLFDQPYVSEDPVTPLSVAREGVEPADRLARQSIVLLHNDEMLPLSREVARIAIVGPHAESLADAVRRLVPHAEVTVAPGCGVTEADPAGLAAAVEAARNAEVVIVALGGRGGWFSPGTEGEAGDTANIDLPAAQVELVKAVTATGTPAVGIVRTGRPFALTAVAEDLPALLHAAYGGPRAAGALADVLFGEVNPSGKLPVSLPRHAGQIPIRSGQRRGSGYRRAATDPHKGSLDLPSTPLYCFGHGLSYTTFDYRDLAVAPQRVDSGAAVAVSLTVTNTGGRAGTEVVQLYLSDHATGITRPTRELADFARISLDPGASARVEFTVELSRLGHLGRDGDFVLEPGPIEVQAGASSDDIRLTGAFEVVREGDEAVLLRHPALAGVPDKLDRLIEPPRTAHP